MPRGLARQKNTNEIKIIQTIIPNYRKTLFGRKTFLAGNPQGGNPGDGRRRRSRFGLNAVGFSRALR